MSLLLINSPRPGYPSDGYRGHPAQEGTMARSKAQLKVRSRFSREPNTASITLVGASGEPDASGVRIELVSLAAHRGVARNAHPEWARSAISNRSHLDSRDRHNVFQGRSPVTDHLAQPTGRLTSASSGIGPIERTCRSPRPDADLTERRRGQPGWPAPHRARTRSPDRHCRAEWLGRQRTPFHGIGFIPRHSAGSNHVSPSRAGHRLVVRTLALGHR